MLRTLIKAPNWFASAGSLQLSVCGAVPEAQAGLYWSCLLIWIGGHVVTLRMTAAPSEHILAAKRTLFSALDYTYMVHYLLCVNAVFWKPRKDCCGRPNLTLNMYKEYFLWDLGVTTFPSDTLCSCEIWVSQHSLPITCVLISVQAPRINLD